MSLLKKIFRGGGDDDDDGGEVGRLLREVLAGDDVDTEGLTQFVLTGKAPTLPPARPKWFGSTSTAELMALLEQGDALVEWRLGTLLPRLGNVNVAPIAPLLGLSRLRKDVPHSDQRIRQLLAAANVPEQVLLEHLLNATRGQSKTSDALRQRPLFDELVRAHPQTVEDSFDVGLELLDSLAKSLVPARA